MIKRCIDISGEATHISAKLNQLVLRRDGAEVGQVPIEDVSVVVIDNPHITYTNHAVEELLKNNVSIVVCGKNHTPVGIMLPLEGHTTQAETIALQIEATDAAKNKIWRDVIKAKIENQARALEKTGTDAEFLFSLSRAVKSGDDDNAEARAAQWYWPRFFGEDFRRHRDGDPPNNMLNYGYAILRASVARAVCGAGFCPTLGIHHRNRYNAFALADDMMEPFRPMVDLAVFELNRNGEKELTPKCKTALLGILSQNVRWDGQNSPLTIALQHYAASLRKTVSGEQKQIEIPQLALEDDAAEEVPF